MSLKREAVISQFDPHYGLKAGLLKSQETILKGCIVAGRQLICVRFNLQHFQLFKNM